ncbi:ROK family protein [Caproiciproducens sp.]|uniref:ROK family protein n=1 Tax=Caproiciproducens sp. TaxID=1954376 RepID=UPI00289FAA95|nr:ROK family protein [Caproiciproducens sp.]
MKNYVAFDIGGTMIKYGIINENGKIVENHETPTEAGRGGPYILKKIQEIIEKSLENHRLDGICISTAGIVDYINGSIIYANDNIPDYTGMKIKEVLESRFHIPCEVENDVMCAGLAEQYSGASKGSKVSVCLTIGTGIGGCILINNKIFHGVAYSAGEVGYMNMFGTEFQELASASALVEKVSRQKNCNQQELDGIKIFEMAKSGDQICIDAIKEMCDMLGYGIANICYVINPEAVIIGGGIAKQQEYLYSLIRQSMDKHLLPALSEKTRLAFASQGNLAGMLGAYYNFKEKH